MRLPKQGGKQWKPIKTCKPRENWTAAEHARFLSALKLYERDWKKIETFVKSKTVIQIRSHAQKYFLKLTKLGRTDAIPPPRSKRRSYRTDRARTTPKPHIPVAGFVKNKFTTLPQPLPPQEHTALMTLPDVQETSSDYDWERGDFSDDLDMENTVIITQPQRRPPDDGFDHSVVYGYLARLLDPSSSGMMQELAAMTPNNRQWCQLLMNNFARNLQTSAYLSPTIPLPT